MPDPEDVGRRSTELPESLVALAETFAPRFAASMSWMMAIAPLTSPCSLVSGIAATLVHTSAPESVS